MRRDELTGATHHLAETDLRFPSFIILELQQ
jgi:hypothetical protein